MLRGGIKNNLLLQPESSAMVILACVKAVPFLEVNSLTSPTSVAIPQMSTILSAGTLAKEAMGTGSTAKATMLPVSLALEIRASAPKVSSYSFLMEVNLLLAS